MRLFLIAFALSALAPFANGQNPASSDGSSGYQPMRSSRFEPSAGQAYRIQRAREDSEHRAAMLRYYDSIGFNYGSPGINGGVFFNTQPPMRYRRMAWGNAWALPTPYGM